MLQFALQSLLLSLSGPAKSAGVISPETYNSTRKIFPVLFSCPNLEYQFWDFDLQQFKWSPLHNQLQCISCESMTRTLLRKTEYLFQAYCLLCSMYRSLPPWKFPYWEQSHRASPARQPAEQESCPILLLVLTFLLGTNTKLRSCNNRGSELIMSCPCLGLSFSMVVKILRTIKTTEDGSPEEATEAVHLLCDLGLAIARILFNEHCKGKETDVTKLPGGCCLPQAFFRAASHKRRGETYLSL